MVILLDRTRRQIGRHHPKSDRHLPAARYRSLHLPDRRPAACGPAPRLARRRTHAPPLENTVRRQSSTLHCIWADPIRQDAAGLTLTSAEQAPGPTWSDSRRPEATARDRQVWASFDARTSITFYVESDGKHVAAIDAHGRVLWVRDPSEQAKLNNSIPIILLLDVMQGSFTDEFRKYVQHERIDADDPFLQITFASNVFGPMDEKTRQFLLIGIN